MDKVLKDYLDSKFESNNLSTWSKYRESSKDLPAKVAHCKLAKKFLTPPPTSTATVRLFSSDGNIAHGRESRETSIPVGEQYDAKHLNLFIYSKTLQIRGLSLNFTGF